MSTRVGERTSLAGVTFGAFGVALAAGGAMLFYSQLPVAGYGLIIMVWGLAFLLGALSRLTERGA